MLDIPPFPQKRKIRFYEVTLRLLTSIGIDPSRR